MFQRVSVQYKYV